MSPRIWMIGGGYIGGSTFETKVTRSMQGLSDTIFRSVRPSVCLSSRSLNISILVWCSVSCCFMRSGALDLQLCCSSIILYNITRIVYNYHTDIYQYSFVFRLSSFVFRLLNLAVMESPGLVLTTNKATECGDLIHSYNTLVPKNGRTVSSILKHNI